MATFGMVLRDSPHKGKADLDLAVRLGTGGMGSDEGGYRTGFLGLLERARDLIAHERSLPAE